MHALRPALGGALRRASSALAEAQGGAAGRHDGPAAALLEAWRAAGNAAVGPASRLAAWRGASAAATADGGATLAPANIWCIGRNYAEHVRELGNELPTTPMIFLKAGSTAVPPGELLLPTWSADVHHEVELAIELGPDLTPIRGAVALDLTARDVQAGLKKQQWPWTLAKSFKGSTPLGPAFSLAGLDATKLGLTLDVNGKRRQTGRTADMLFSLPTQVAYVLKHFPVVPGDVLLTGTPPGVCKMAPGDEVVARVLGPAGEVLSEGVWRVRAEG